MKKQILRTLLGVLTISAMFVFHSDTVSASDTDIVYDSDDIYGYERIKIGDGKTVVSNLPFIADEIKIEIKAYINQVLYGIIDGTIKTIFRNLG